MFGINSLAYKLNIIFILPISSHTKDSFFCWFVEWISDWVSALRAAGSIPVWNKYLYGLQILASGYVHVRFVCKIQEKFEARQSFIKKK